MSESSVASWIAADGVMMVKLDLPGKPVNLLCSEILRTLEELVARIEQDKPRGVVFTSAKTRSFIAGADLLELQRLSRYQLDVLLAQGQAVFARIAALPMPTAAAMNGDALGGGLELALACSARVAVDDRSIMLGLPEVKLGLVPGFGGTIRLPWLIGLAPGLSLMISGRVVPPREALRLGILDEVVERESLVQAARRLVLAGASHHQKRASNPSPQERNRILDDAEYESDRQLQGHYPAADKLVEIVRAGYEHGQTAGLLAERRTLIDLMESPTARNLMRNFFLQQGARKAAATQAGAPPIAVGRVAVVGSSAMGVEIACDLARAGLDALLFDHSNPSAAADADRVRMLLDAEVAGGRMDQSEAEALWSRVKTSTDWAALTQVDMVIDAAGEDFAAKSEILEKAAHHARPEAVLAANTGLLSVRALAAATARPGQVIGMHFPNAGSRAALVEVIHAPESRNEALATAVWLASRMGKAPILAGDVPGFVINRILAPYLSEAMQMAAQGIAVETIDRAMVGWGMATGPFSLMDRIGLDGVANMLATLGPYLEGRVVLPRSLAEAVDRGWLGRKSGQGWYIYESTADRGLPPVNHGLAARMMREPVSRPTDEEIQWRLALMMVNEAARILDQRVCESADAIDLASLLGLGVGGFRGGLIRFADSVGASGLVNRLESLAGSQGRRFTPAALLVEAAKARSPIAQTRRP